MYDCDHKLCCIYGLLISEEKIAETTREIQERAKKVMKEIDDVFSGEEWEKSFCREINIWCGTHINGFLNATKSFRDNFRFYNIMCPELLSLKVADIDFDMDELKFEVEVIHLDKLQQHLSEVKNFFPQVLLSEFDVEITAGNNGQVVCPSSTFNDLKSKGRLIWINRSKVQGICKVKNLTSWKGRDVMVMVTLSKIAIKNSPFMVFVDGFNGNNTIINEKLKGIAASLELEAPSHR